MEVRRFDFNGVSREFKRTSQGFLRVNARLTRTGVFEYESGREYRSAEEVFRDDSLSLMKGALVTDLHPSEIGAESFLSPGNAKAHVIGFTESVERDGEFLKGSLIIFHHDAITAIEKGARKEISLGYTCRLEPSTGAVNGESYDVIQRDIVVNHVAIGPEGWGRAGAECAIRRDSILLKGQSMTEFISVDGNDIALTKEAVAHLLAEKKREFNEVRAKQFRFQTNRAAAKLTTKGQALLRSLRVSSHKLWKQGLACVGLD